MKQVLFTTTALVAFSGAAMADVTWSGSASLGYNDGAGELAEGINSDIDLDVTMSNGGGYSATVSATFFGQLSIRRNPTVAPCFRFLEKDCDCGCWRRFARWPRGRWSCCCGRTRTRTSRATSRRRRTGTLCTWRWSCARARSLTASRCVCVCVCVCVCE